MTDPDHARRLAAARRAVEAAADTDWPGHVLDQVAAAARDAWDLTDALAVGLRVADPDQRWRSMKPPGQVGAEAIARIVAATGDADACSHLRTGAGPQPMVARLALHRVDCHRCAVTVRRAPTDEDDRCDWCGARGVVMFTPAIITAGAVTAVGDACDDCADLLGMRTAVNR